MFRQTLLALMLGFCAIPSTAFAWADDPECKEASRKIVKETGSTFDKVEGLSQTIYFSNPGADWITLDCDHGAVLSMMGIASPFPNDEFFNMAARVAQEVTGKDAAAFAERIRLCQKVALDAPDHAQDYIWDDVKFGCTVEMTKGTFFYVSKKKR